MIYFIQDTVNLAIKIGHAASDIDARRRQLQTGNPHPLVVIWHMDGTPDLETALHRRFAADRGLGEWFRPSTELILFLLDEAQMHGRHTAMGDYERAMECASRS